MERSIESEWGLVNPRVVRVLQTKGDREALVVESEGGSYVMKTFGPSRPEGLIRNDTGVLAFLGDSGFGHSPMLRCTTAGGTYTRIGGRLAYMMEYIEGHEPPRTVETHVTLGRIAARLHNLKGWDTPSSLKPREELREAVGYAYDNGFAFAGDLERLVEGLPCYETMPHGLIHTDIGPHNSILDKNGRIVLIDWDDAGNGCIPIDAGYPLICQSMSVREGQPVFNGDLAGAFYGEYLRSAPYIDPETLLAGALFFAITYMRYGNPDDCWAMIGWATKNLRDWSVTGQC